mmetsp:Transcript_20306/g.60600  ORF Transcript_20306/g.60600 Transcript_20306/m.60600 type:complete len:215 (-) Transcript_20306:528-1172(-)
MSVRRPRGVSRKARGARAGPRRFFSFVARPRRILDAGRAAGAVQRRAPAARVPRHHAVGRLHGHDEAIILCAHECGAAKEVHHNRCPNETETHPIKQRRPRRRGGRRGNRPAQRLPREPALGRRDAVHGVSDTHIPDAVSPHETYSFSLVAEAVRRIVLGRVCHVVDHDAVRASHGPKIIRVDQQQGRLVLCRATPSFSDTVVVRLGAHVRGAV